MADTIESLELEIKHSASGADAEIAKITSSLRSLSKTLTTVLPKLQNLSTQLNAVKGAGGLNINESNYTQSLTQNAEIINNVGKASQAAGKATKESANGIKAMAKVASKAKGPLENFVASLKRIAFYRIIRSIIKAITQALQEGLQNAYAFSQGIEGSGHRFAEAMDSMKTAGSTMKNQLGSAFIALLAAIAPIVNAIISLVTKLADALSQIFSAFTGKTYLKAQTNLQKWQDTAAGGAKATKEWKNQLLGFDEINRLEAPSDTGGGGGGGGIDPSQMFDDTPLSEWAQKLHDFLANLTLSFDNIFFKWRNLTPEDIAQKVITGLTAVAGGIIGFTLGGPGGAALGMTIGAGLGVVISSLIFNNNGKIDENEFVSMIIAAMGGIAGAIIGFSIGGVTGAALGFILGVSISLVLQKMNWLNPIKGQSAEVVQEYLDGVKEQFDAATPGTYEASYFGRWKSYAERQMQQAGKASADGFDEGVEGEFTVLGWLSDVWERIKDNVRTSFGIHSPSTVFKDFGNNIMQGLWDGMKDKWSGFEEWFETAWDNFSSWWSNLHLSPFNITLPHISVSFDDYSGGWGASLLRFLGVRSIPHISVAWYAQGGFPNMGDLFIANEAGPEMVGTIGGRTAVANNDQIVEAIRGGVFEAVSAAMSQSGGSNTPVNIYLDGKQIATSTTRYQKQLARAMG